jgi:hypothetical protein
VTPSKNVTASNNVALPMLVLLALAGVAWNLHFPARDVGAQSEATIDVETS